MTAAATLTRRAPTALDVLHADRDAIQAAIVSLRHRAATSGGRVPFEVAPYLASAEARLAEVEGEIRAVEAGR